LTICGFDGELIVNKDKDLGDLGKSVRQVCPDAVASRQNPVQFGNIVGSTMV